MEMNKTIMPLLVFGAILFSNCGLANKTVEWPESEIKESSTGDMEGHQADATIEPGGIASGLDVGTSSIAYYPDGGYLIYSIPVSEHWTFFYAFRAEDINWPEPKESTAKSEIDNEPSLIRGLVANNGKYMILFGETESEIYAFKIHDKPPETLLV